MHLSKLSATNFKGRSFNYALSPLTQIVGPNFSGKTALADSIRLALIGHISENGKTNDATFELSSGMRMEVTVGMSDGTMIMREFWRDGESIKSAGPKKSLCPALMDAAEYFGLTDAQRLDYIAARVVLPAGAKAETILTDLGVLLKDVPSHIHGELIVTIAAGLVETDVSTAITSMTAKDGLLPTLYTEWNAKQKNTMGAIRTLADLKNREGECSAETVATLQEQFTRLNNELSKANSRQGELASQALQANQARARREELKEIVTSVQPQPAEMPVKQSQPTYDRARLEVELAQAEDKLGKLRTPDRSAADEHLRNCANIAAKANAERDQRKAGSDEIKEELEALKEHATCPFCKSKAKGWQKRVEAELVAKLNAAAGAYAIHDGIAKAAANDLASAEELARKEAKLENDRIALATHRQSIIDKIRVLDDAAANYQRSCERITHQNEMAKAGHAQEVKSAQEELDAMVDPETIDASALQNVATTVERLKGELREVMAQRDAATALQQDIKRAAEAAEEHEEAKQWAAAITVAGKFLKERQGETITKLFTTLLEKANRYTTGILRAPLAFHGGDVGYFIGGHFVTHRTMSGTEKALTYIAVAAALSEAAEGPRIVLLDELGRVDRRNVERVMDRFSQAVAAGWIDQAIVIDTEERVVADQWQTINLAAA